MKTTRYLHGTRPPLKTIWNKYSYAQLARRAPIFSKLTRKTAKGGMNLCCWLACTLIKIVHERRKRAYMARKYRAVGAVGPAAAAAAGVAVSPVPPAAAAAAPPPVGATAWIPPRL
jgi:hypothetical protein